MCILVEWITLSPISTLVCTFHTLKTSFFVMNYFRILIKFIPCNRFCKPTMSLKKKSYFPTEIMQYKVNWLITGYDTAFTLLCNYLFKSWTSLNSPSKMTNQCTYCIWIYIILKAMLKFSKTVTLIAFHQICMFINWLYMSLQITPYNAF